MQLKELDVLASGSSRRSFSSSCALQNSPLSLTRLTTED